MLLTFGLLIQGVLWVVSQGGPRGCSIRAVLMNDSVASEHRTGRSTIHMVQHLHGVVGIYQAVSLPWLLVPDNRSGSAY
jgi:hypothetical protein